MFIRYVALVLGSTILGLGIGIAVANQPAGLLGGLGAGLVLAAASTVVPRGA